MPDPYYNEALMNEHEGAPDIMAIGDSWFWYPTCNLLWSINAALRRRFVIFAHGANGMNAQQWVQSNFRRQWSMSVRSYRDRLKLLLLSGGGNDFAGVPDFNNIVRHNCSTANSVDDCWDGNKAAVLFRHIAGAYRSVIETTRSSGYSGPIVLHNYDYARPTGIGFLGPAKWLKVPMDQARIPEHLRVPLIQALIDTLELELRAIASEFGNVVFIDSAGTLGDDDWANEIHPTEAGFNRIVRTAWMPAIRGLLPA